MDTVRYCKKHKKHFHPKDTCPVCEAIDKLKGTDYERKIEYNQDYQECEQTGLCGGRCSNKGCTH